MREADGIFRHNRITRSFVRRNASVRVMSARLQLHFPHPSPVLQHINCQTQARYQGVERNSTPYVNVFAL
jgi:hypothetical protein